MNNVWSEHVQGIMTLYLSRKLRFDDVFFEQYNRVFHLDTEADLKILEIGCGPGALAESLHRWYPKAEITAIDRDSNFISFAQDKIAGVTFMEGDATRLPFADNSFDVTISNTVQEHVSWAITSSTDRAFQSFCAKWHRVIRAQPYSDTTYVIPESTAWLNLMKTVWRSR